MTADHIPLTRIWICRSCGDPWPCIATQNATLAYFADSRATLRLLMTDLFARAADDLRELPAGMLRDRFIGWIGDHTEPTPAPVFAHPTLRNGWKRP